MAQARGERTPARRAGARPSGARTSAAQKARADGPATGRQRKSRSAGVSRSRDTASAPRADAGVATKGASSGAQRAGEAGKTAAKTVVVPLVTGAVGVLAGVAVARRALKGGRKVLGIPLPGRRTGLDGVAKQIGEAGRQFAKLAEEVRTTRERAEEIGKALS
jgi:hypothetical protein